MGARVLIVAVAGLSAAATAAAEPAKAPVHKAEELAEQPVKVVVASADEVAGAVAKDQQEPAATPAKRTRKARVTTCRCGDQTNPND